MGCVSSRPQVDDALDEKRALLIEYASRVTHTSQVDTSERLHALREAMRACCVDAYVIGTEDAHASEYSAACDQRLTYISGFTGSTATAVVLADSAHLFTDGRYHVQAAQQLSRAWTLHRVGEPHVASWREWLQGPDVPRGAYVGMDASLVSYKDAVTLKAALASRGVTLVFPEANLVDDIWGEARPEPMLEPVYEYKLQFAGVHAAEKLAKLREWLREQGTSSAYVISALDEVAWLLNLRGASIPCHPVFPAYMIVTQHAAALFVDPRLIRPPIQTYLAKLQVSIYDYDAVWRSLREAEYERVFVDVRASYALVHAAGEVRTIVQTAASPVALAKARKNAVEILCMKRAYKRDGAAWAKWAAWMEDEMKRGANLSERRAADALERIRAKDPLYAGMQAYDAISATGANAALPHYETPLEDAPLIDRVSPYLNDSGPQYYDGTIDTTRTMHFGTPTPEQKRAYTRVLQGHIALSRAKFPQGTTGAQLDMLARQPLFQDGLNYLHGTGHGIGAFLNVHEGPHGFSSSSGGASVPVALQPGMILSNEPGYYKTGAFGIRIESAMLVRPASPASDSHEWLEFATLTRVPISTKLVDGSLLRPDEAAWLRAYNEQCRDDILPLVKGDYRAEKWLQRQTLWPIP